MTFKDLTVINPALSLMGEFGKLSHNTSTYIHQMRQEAIFSDGIFPAKLKALAATLWGISACCEPCLKFYILKAKALGVTEQEVGEFLAIASVMGGCVGEMWALKAYQVFKEAEGSKDSTPAEGCCT